MKDLFSILKISITKIERKILFFLEVIYMQIKNATSAEYFSMCEFPVDDSFVS